MGLSLLIATIKVTSPFALKGLAIQTLGKGLSDGFAWTLFFWYLKKAYKM